MTVWLLLFSFTAAHAEPAFKPGQLPADDSLSQVSVDSSAREGFVLEAGATFAWRTAAVWSQNEAIPLSATFTVEDVSFTIEAALADRGMIFVAPNDSRYEIVAAVLVGSDAEAAGVAELLEFYPKLPAVQQHDTGTLLMAISRPGHPELLWRGSAQVFLLGSDFSDEQRIQRFKQVVARLVATIPVAQALP